MHIATLVLCALLLCGCAPTITSIVKSDPLTLRLAPSGDYMALMIDAGVEPAINTVLRFSGRDIRLNDDKCRISGQDVICSLGNINRYTLPFLGTIVDANLTWYRRDGTQYKTAL